MASGKGHQLDVNKDVVELFQRIQGDEAGVRNFFVDQPFVFLALTRAIVALHQGTTVTELKATGLFCRGYGLEYWFWLVVNKVPAKATVPI